MKFQLSRRPRASVFDLSAGQAFFHKGEVYLMVPLARLVTGETVNCVKLSTGTLYNFGSEIEIELLSGTFLEDEIPNEVTEDL